jgi:hypothetical protein
MDNINEKLDIIIEKLDKLTSIIESDISNNCKKMGNHINFVENIYDTIKSPLSYICNRVNRITNNNELPALENK